MAAGGGTKVYGSGDPALTATTQSGFIPGDVAGITLASTRGVGETVASYVTTATAIGGNVGNYTITYTPGNFTITAKAVTVTATAGQNKVYGTSDPAFTYTVSPALSYTDQFTGALTRAAGPNVGTYAITLYTLALSSNYTLTYVPADFTITKAPASVTPAPKAKVFGAVDPTLSGTLLGFVPTDGVTATYNRSPAGETVLGGPYTISATLSPATVLSNYTIIYNTAAFTITQATATISVTGYDAIYNGMPQTATATATGVTGTNLISMLNLSGTTHMDVGAWSDPWTFTDPAGNYCTHQRKRSRQDPVRSGGLRPPARPVDVQLLHGPDLSLDDDVHIQHRDDHARGRDSGWKPDIAWRYPYGEDQFRHAERDYRCDLADFERSEPPGGPCDSGQPDRRDGSSIRAVCPERERPLPQLFDRGDGGRQLQYANAYVAGHSDLGVPCKGWNHREQPAGCRQQQRVGRVLDVG